MTLSIVITVHNQSKFLEECVLSAINQNVKEKEIIIIENGSNDQSATILNQLEKTHPDLKIIYKSSNVGICKAFNEGFKLSTGKYLIDLSGDDILNPDFAEKSIKNLESRDKGYGVSFSNASYIDENSEFLGLHFPFNGKKSRMKSHPPEGDIYSDLLARFIIKAPTMLIKKKVLQDLNGYDESLVYEDFDFWIRSSRNWKYAFIDEVLVKVRIHNMNFSSRMINKKDLSFAWSTFKVCMKARKLNRNKLENKALHKRCSYHLRQSVLSEKFRLSKMYYSLIKDIDNPSLIDRIFFLLAILQLPVFPFYRMYIKNH